MDLAQLSAAVKASGIPVVLYWSTPVNVLVWVFAPDGNEVRAVFLPESALSERAERVVAVGTDAAEPEDGAAQEARQLYPYLLAPFERWLTGRQFLIVPQGPLVGLLFEMLVDPMSGEFVAQKWAVSYAPNATLAARALRSEPQALSKIHAIWDPNVELLTGEVQKIKEVAGVCVTDEAVEFSIC